jgi:hypothetical protein
MLAARHLVPASLKLAPPATLRHHNRLFQGDPPWVEYQDGIGRYLMRAIVNTSLEADRSEHSTLSEYCWVTTRCPKRLCNQGMMPSNL